MPQPAASLGNRLTEETILEIATVPANRFLAGHDRVERQLWAQAPSTVDKAAGTAKQQSTSPHLAVSELLRYEPTGLSILHPYVRGKIPVIFIHGLWSTPWSWGRTIAALQTDPSLNSRYQFWTFGYSTGDPIPYSATLLSAILRLAQSQV